MSDLFFQADTYLALLTLTLLEIVLGVDNIVFISILTGKLPPEMRARARTIGLSLAMVMRVLLLFSLSWLIKLTAPLFSILQNEISGRDIVLMAGGVFLLAKGTLEIHDKLEGEEAQGGAKTRTTFSGILIQIMLLDIIFSLDSVITAVGMADHLIVMVLAVVIAVGFMMVSSGWISRFIEEHPTVKMLALSFLLLVGFALVADGLDMHVPKGYIYFAMAFSVFVEILNIKIKKQRALPLKLRSHYKADIGANI